MVCMALIATIVLCTRSHDKFISASAWDARCVSYLTATRTENIFVFQHLDKRDEMPSQSSSETTAMWRGIQQTSHIEMRDDGIEPKSCIINSPGNFGEVPKLPKKPILGKFETLYVWVLRRL